jgi:predicted nucleic acid-binding protein
VIVVDSYGWIEYLADSPLASQYEKYLQKPEEVITPSLVMYEVYKKVKREKGEELALLVVAQIEKTKVVALDEEIALVAADLSISHMLPLADAVVYATAKREKVQIATSDAHFKDLDEVVFLPCEQT